MAPAVHDRRRGAGAQLVRHLSPGASVALVDQVSCGVEGPKMIEQHDHCWRKSSRSATLPNCVELTFTGDTVLIRDSKSPERMLTIPRPLMAALVDAVSTGHLASHP